MLNRNKLLAVMAVTAGVASSQAVARPESERLLACRANALTAAERARSTELRNTLVSATVEVTETADGFTYRYRDEPSIYALLTEWIALERRCCSFFDFRVDWRATDSSPRLTLGGGAAVKEFLRQAMKEMPQAPRESTNAR